MEDEKQRQVKKSRHEEEFKAQDFYRRLNHGFDIDTMAKMAFASALPSCGIAYSDVTSILTHSEMNRLIDDRVLKSCNTDSVVPRMCAMCVSCKGPNRLQDLKSKCTPKQLYDEHQGALYAFLFMIEIFLTYQSWSQRVAMLDRIVAWLEQRNQMESRSIQMWFLPFRARVRLVHTAMTRLYTQVLQSMTSKLFDEYPVDLLLEIMEWL
jgi:hypothetical protein